MEAARGSARQPAYAEALAALDGGAVRDLRIVPGRLRPVVPFDREPRRNYAGSMITSVFCFPTLTMPLGG